MQLKAVRIEGESIQLGFARLVRETLTQPVPGHGYRVRGRRHYLSLEWRDPPRKMPDHSWRFEAETECGKRLQFAAYCANGLDTICPGEIRQFEIDGAVTEL